MKYELETNPTFKAEVGLYLPGKGTATIIFDFKARSRIELDEFQKQLLVDAQAFRERHGGDLSMEVQMKAEVQQIMGVATGWNLPSEFNEQNLFTLVNKTPDAMQVIFQTYLRELTGGRAGN